MMIKLLCVILIYFIVLFRIIFRQSSKAGKADSSKAGKAVVVSNLH